MGRPPCCDKSSVKRGLWTAEEDAKILAYVSRHGTDNWTSVPKKAGLKRCAKSCRLRWTNYLRPDLKHERFTPEEEELIVKLHETIGSRWSLIAAQLPGRTDNDVKNYWNTKLKKKLKEMGIDHVTHRPFSQVIADYASIGLSKPAKDPNMTPINHPQSVIVFCATNQDYPGNPIMGTMQSTPRHHPHQSLPSEDGLSMVDHPWDILHQLQTIKLISQTPNEHSPHHTAYESYHTPNEFYEVANESHQTASNPHVTVNQSHEINESYHTVNQSHQTINGSYQTLHESTSSCTTMTSASCSEQPHVSKYHFKESPSNWIEILVQDEMPLPPMENVSPIEQYMDQSWDFSCGQQMQCMFGSNNLVDFTKSEIGESADFMDKVRFSCKEFPYDGMYQENSEMNGILGSPLADGFEDGSSILMWDFPELLDLEHPLKGFSLEKAPYSLKT